MISRAKLLDAAAKVYGESGYRGATTRRIADAAGVNEITIFRLFGSKAALIDEAVRTRSAVHPDERHRLPSVPVDPERELVAWASAHLAQLRADRSMIRKALSELEERPGAAPCVTEGARCAKHELREYMQRLARHGLADFTRAADDCGRVDPNAAAAMLTAALFADAMGRDVMSDMYPQPAERAPAMYVRLFLRAIGCVRPAAARTRRTGAAARAARPTPSPSRSSR